MQSYLDTVYKSTVCKKFPGEIEYEDTNVYNFNACLIDFEFSTHESYLAFHSLGY